MFIFSRVAILYALRNGEPHPLSKYAKRENITRFLAQAFFVIMQNQYLLGLFMYRSCGI